MQPIKARKRNRHGKSKRPGISKAKALAIAHRRAIVADLYLQGRQQYEIARELKVDDSTITRDLDALDRQWQADGVEKIDAYKARELQRLDRVERQAWEQWERSKENAWSSTEEKSGEKVITKITTKRQCGDPRYLGIVNDCITQRCKILGLYAVEKKQPLAVTIDMLERLSDADLQRIHDGEDPEFVLTHSSQPGPRQIDVGPPAATAAMVTS